MRSTNPTPSLPSCGPSESGTTSLSLLPRVQARDPEAWERIVRLYSPLVFHWCRRAGLSAEDAADVLQNVFLAVAKGIGDFHRDANGSFRAWLRAICRFKVADHYRTAYTEPGAVGGSTAYRDLLQQADSPNDDSESEDRNRLLRTALELVRGDFSGPTWEAFWQYVVQNRPAAEVASALGLSLDSVYQSKARVLRRLRDEFEHLLP